MTYTATYSSDDMTIHFSACGHDSYHDDFVEITEVEIYCMEILGVDVVFKSLPDTLQSAILELSNECEFEPQG